MGNYHQMNAGGVSMTSAEREYQASLHVYSFYGVSLDDGQRQRLMDWCEGHRVGYGHNGKQKACGGR